MIELTKTEAKQWIIEKHLLRQSLLSGKEGLIKLFRQLSYVQIDTIQVVERAHHHTIWTRIPGYNKQWLDELQTQDRAIFEYFAHAASYISMEDYRFYLPRMNAKPTDWVKQFQETYKKLMSDVLQRITNEGALGSKDFQAKVKSNHRIWGSVKTERTALEVLYWQGKLMITRREKFQKIYDLPERVLPSCVCTKVPSDEERLRHFILRALEAMGIGVETDVRNHFMLRKTPSWSKTFKQLIESNEIKALQIQGLKDVYYCISTDLSNFPRHSNRLGNSHELDPTTSLFILSPFDNAIILRNRTKNIFDFDYKLECYVPKEKRIYGYWCLPILHGNTFIGRVDCKADRKSKTLHILQIHWENNKSPNHDTMELITIQFQRFAKFCGCHEVFYQGHLLHGSFLV